MFSTLHQAACQVGEVIVGKDLQIRQALACLLAGGHLLIEDVPGVGKTTLAHALAVSLGLQWKRQQFTSDLLPADVAGMSVYDRASTSFVFHPGPLFTQVLLADEINRATPRTQSGLLEAMEERQVSLDGVTHALPQPFFVIATQNGQHQAGTFPLPESQLDRFLMCITLGYPDAAAERALLLGLDRRAMLRSLAPVLQAGQLLAMQAALRQVHVSAVLADYVLALVHATRTGELFAEGLSPRAALALLQAARAWAALAGRDHVTPDDVQAMLLPVCAHRLRPRQGGQNSGALLRQILLATPV
ncbi:AAA family ATPase [Janthinobacterium psychrotolerans]|uniref:MoxR-like ATPase n=1 Tax=Janthinobacterium psychrotolerans TaxID=1747903 RepID=A0A1A7C3B5_9BURK|nr:MoxR family ATPase [Janthinobacterium psychrotolerans]OBV39215.1 MoxR-like ATPase [Janthinobacterium psychrotolerans]